MTAPGLPTIEKSTLNNAKACATLERLLSQVPLPTMAFASTSRQHFCGVCSLPVDNSLDMGCIFHGCAAPGCSQLRLEDSSFCTEHACRIRGCSTVRQPCRLFCQQHQCRVKNCVHAVDTEQNSPYCPTHACSKSGCSNQRMDWGKCCTYHSGRGTQSFSKRPSSSWLTTRYLP